MSQADNLYTLLIVHKDNPLNILYIQNRKPEIFNNLDISLSFFELIYNIMKMKKIYSKEQFLQQIISNDYKFTVIDRNELLVYLISSKDLDNNLIEFLGYTSIYMLLSGKTAAKESFNEFNESEKILYKKLKQNSDLMEKKIKQGIIGELEEKSIEALKQIKLELDRKIDEIRQIRKKAKLSF